ncbi:hypothetical protein J5N97_013425 [Dioscorea zingiberensis]|uniref:Uncharacterized protein n=1 Tax=Dioscorea zingiberensis TaxID=325984 RepID=A0A9D5CQQ2_9LILI|nr:hypothetical protein J5N97_013425 [Dioscorea zingiberensis]
MSEPETEIPLHLNWRSSSNIRRRTPAAKLISNPDPMAERPSPGDWFLNPAGVDWFLLPSPWPPRQSHYGLRSLHPIKKRIDKILLAKDPIPSGYILHYGLDVTNVVLTILEHSLKGLVKLELAKCEGGYGGINVIGWCYFMLEGLTLTNHQMDVGWLVGLSFCGNLKTQRSRGCRSIDANPDLSKISLNAPFPSCAAEFKSLKFLNLSNCDLTGEVPETLGNLKNLQFLELSNNQLTGAVLLSFANLKMLRELMLSSNLSSGNLMTIINFTGLRKLSLSGNAFLGSIPLDLGNLNNLEYLDLSMNSLSGALPPSFANLTMLLHFDARRNTLTGPIFPYIRSLLKPLIMDLSHNSMTGSLPEEIGNLTILEALWLGSNEFSRSIPVEIGNLKWLEVFSCHSCKLIGNIPDEISNLRRLPNLDISENSFKEELPAEEAAAATKKIAAAAGVAVEIMGRKDIGGKLHPVPKINVLKIAAKQEKERRKPISAILPA